MPAPGTSPTRFRSISTAFRPSICWTACRQRQRNDRQQRSCKGFHPEQLRDLVYQPPHCAHQPAVGQGAFGAGKEDGKAQGARPGQQELQGQTAQLLPGEKKFCHTTATPFKKA